MSKEVVQDLELESEQAEEQAPREIEDKLGLVQALIFAHGEPLGLDTIQSITGIDLDELKALVAEIQLKIREEFSGLELVEIGSKFQYRTRKEFSFFLRQLKAARPRKLSPQSLEALAIVAYRQPIVKSDIETLRGVDCTPVLATLLDRNLIKIVGHQASVGNPALYGTTDDFLKLFGLKSLSELPTLRDLKELDDPGELSEEEADEAPQISTQAQNTDNSDKTDSNDLAVGQ